MPVRAHHVAKELDLAHANVTLLGPQGEPRAGEPIEDHGHVREVLLPGVTEDGEIVDVVGGEALEPNEHPVHNGLKGGGSGLHAYAHDQHALPPVPREVNGHEPRGPR